MHWSFKDEAPFFVLDPDGDGLEYFTSEEERNKFAKECIEGYRDDGWDENVTGVVAGKVTHRATQVNRTDRPPEGEIDEDGLDSDGEYWEGDVEYKCTYKMLPVKICGT